MTNVYVVANTYGAALAHATMNGYESFGYIRDLSGWRIRHLPSIVVFSESAKELNDYELLKKHYAIELATGKNPHDINTIIPKMLDEEDMQAKAAKIVEEWHRVPKVAIEPKVNKVEKSLWNSVVSFFGRSIF